MPNNRQKFANLDNRGGEGEQNQAQQGEEGNANQGEGDDLQGEGEGDRDGDSEPEPKYTDADMDAIVKKRIARERKTIEAEIRKQIEQEAQAKKSEADKLKDMTELQKAQYAAKKLEEEKAALQNKLDLREQTDIARAELASAGINLGDDLLAMFVSEDAEVTSAAIDKLKELFPKAVDEGVQNALKRKTPTADTKPSEGSWAADYAKKYTQSKNPNGGDN